MVSRILCWAAAAGVTLASGQNLATDSLEIASSQIQPVAAGNRKAALDLLDRARNNYALRATGAAYDLKVSFAVDSGGRTQYDGGWEMEEIFDPNHGLRWTARAAAGYAVTRISSHGQLYWEGTANYIPLRLQEARAALFDAMAPAEIASRQRLRIAEAAFQGAPVTCVLLTSSPGAAAASAERRWQETQDCIDPRSGLLQLHSPVPGRYFAYDYSSAPEIAGHVLPRKIIVGEGGRIVSQIVVESLRQISAADPGLFEPTEEMKVRGRAITMGGAQKVWRRASGALAQPVCVFGLVTPSGELIEAHSLQPSDPSSQAAVEAAKQMAFPPLPGQFPEQHFLYLMVSPR